MEDTISVSQGQATTEQTEPVAPIETPVVPFDKAELKSLLQEIVSDITSNSPTHETAQQLLTEFTAAKDDFVALCQRVEEAIKKLT